MKCVRAPSADYLDAVKDCADFHTTSQYFHGRHVLASLDLIWAFFRRHEVRTVLDYGCGKGEQHGPFTLPDGREFSSLGSALDAKFTLYDPTVPSFAELPTKPSDAVVVYDVLEYVPKGDCRWVFEEIFSLATKCVFVNASTIAPKKLVKEFDRPTAWWLRFFSKVMPHTSADWLLRLQVAPGVFHLYRRGQRNTCEFWRPET